MFRCDDVSGLISRSMDEKLPFGIRLGIRIHLMMCKLCTRYKEQLLVLREAMSMLDKQDEEDFTMIKLPEEAAFRIKSQLEAAK